MRDAYYALLTQDIISGIWFDEMLNYSARLLSKSWSSFIYGVVALKEILDMNTDNERDIKEISLFLIGEEII